MSLISVIVPIYNVEKYLDKCIESIVNQTYKNLEIILVDDGSPYNCPQMCDDWVKKDNRIKVIHEVNGGAGAARNAGIKVSKGEWIGFVDGDDSIDEDYYETLLNKSNDGYYDIVACGFQYVSNDQISFSNDYYNDEHEFTKDELLAEYFDYCKSQWVSFCNKIIKRELFNGLEFPENRYFEDWTLAPMVYYNADKILYIPEYKYRYFIRQGSAMRTETIKRYLDCVRADYEHYLFFNNHDIEIYNDKIKAFITSDFKKCVKVYGGAKDKPFMKEAYIKCRKVNDDFKIKLYYKFASLIKIIYKIVRE